MELREQAEGVPYPGFSDIPFVPSVAIVSQWQQESKEKVVSLLLSHLPLLQPGNTEAKSEYMRLLQKVLAYSIESNAFIEESRQLLSYALIHPATTLEDRNALALWLSHLEERLASGFRTRPEPTYHSRQGSDEWGGPAELGPGEAGPGWQDKPPRENGHVPFHPSSSVPPAINSIGSNANTGEGVGGPRRPYLLEKGQTGLSLFTCSLVLGKSHDLSGPQLYEAVQRL